VKDIDEISSDVIAAAIHIHRELGPGLLERVYQTVLAGSLTRSGYAVETEKSIDIHFDGMTFPAAFRIDLIVDQRLIVEIKTIDRLAPVHAKQLLTYLRLTDQPVGLLLNFSGETMKEGIRRIVNNHDR
jgi:GxxExxY protein